MFTAPCSRSFLAGVLAFLTLAAPLLAQRKVVAYVPNWIDLKTFAETIDYAKLTHINIAFENPVNAEGDLSFNAGNTALIAKARANRVKVLISIGGGGASGDKALQARYFDLLSEPKRAGFAARLAEYLTAHDFDGLDVDIEGPSINEDYGPFIKELAGVLKPRGKLLTAALSQGYGGGKVPAAVLAHLDFINIMAYDGAGYWQPDAPGQHSSLAFAKQQVAWWLDRGVPKAKAVLGVPFYGYGFGKAFKKRDYPYSTILASYPGAEKLDQAGETIWYNGIPTIKAKSQLVVDEDLAGVMIWSLDSDVKGPHSLLTAIHETLQPSKGHAPFVITVVDEQTGRGVPLVELKMVNSASWWTDSAGVVAFDEPGLMGQEVYFYVTSPGYEYPKDGFKYRGVKLRPVPGGRAEVKLKRIQIAERLYRITGQGIYRDSVLAGLPVPIREPLLNGLVMGQDTVIATPYAGKLFWFWGDTLRVSYPLGNFGASGATSLPPGSGGLNPSQGVDLTYFTGKDGFSRPMCPDSEFGEGIKWIESVMTVRDAGSEKLVARLAAGTGTETTREWHLAQWDDTKQHFVSLVRWPVHDSHDSSHPFRAMVDGVDYLYLFPDLRVRAELSALREFKNYEAFTCLAGDGTVDRDAPGRVRYSWKPGAERLHQGRFRELTKQGKLKPGDSWPHLIDIETGKPVPPGRGSVFWNTFRHRWVMIVSGEAGEIWFSEADTPSGPWAFARRVATHGRYNFYNPVHHPFFDEPGGRLIYFEGTYTDSFSSAPAKTPRYDYNQMMYRLTLDDERLALPAPVYRVEKPGKESQLLPGEAVKAQHAWADVQEIAFFAIPSAQPRAGLVQIYRGEKPGNFQTIPRFPDEIPLFQALPGSAADPMSDPLPGPDGKPLCRVWKNPLTVLTADFLPPPVPAPAR